MRSGARNGGVLALLLTFAGRAGAHDLAVECHVQGDRVEVTAYYDDDTDCKGAAVRVENATKQLVAEGRLDEKGHWSFPRPKPGRYSVAVNDGAGHAVRAPFVVPDTQRRGGLERINDGPDRAAFTRFRWVGLALGLATLAAGFLVYRLVRRT